MEIFSLWILFKKLIFLLILKLNIMETVKYKNVYILHQNVNE